MKTIEVVVQDSEPLVMAFDDDGGKVFVDGRGVHLWEDVKSIPRPQREVIKEVYTKLDELQSDLFDMLSSMPFKELKELSAW